MKKHKQNRNRSESREEGERRGKEGRKREERVGCANSYLYPNLWAKT